MCVYVFIHARVTLRKKQKAETPVYCTGNRVIDMILPHTHCVPARANACKHQLCDDRAGFESYLQVLLSA